MQGRTIVLGLATATTGLIAGVYYGFSVAVNPGLARLPAPAYIAAMQAINEVIVNPLFAASFFGAPLLLPLATVLHAGRPHSQRFRLLVAASGLFLVGSLGVTVGGNIPLNDALAAFPLATATPAAAEAARVQFASPWNRWHTVRTLASTAALTLAVAACLASPTGRPALTPE
ncbi:anthrone oxygenase family protein [Hymenobacter armeniacus]|uniref:DUF1772 domain-containing protein n=1 Tax=Hymenobacter armeniacus TaxID=2771358 RepID=A0ABR8JXA8_9BACT|nr:anthrone oxygenase family protein [Hymenobacter armeniacus]MBD2722564.1 DUF1772 domain-containing protein [Hymenobacter armeniacus]